MSNSLSRADGLEKLHSSREGGNSSVKGARGSRRLKGGRSERTKGSIARKVTLATLRDESTRVRAREQLVKKKRTEVSNVPSLQRRVLSFLTKNQYKGCLRQKNKPFASGSCVAAWILRTSGDNWS